MSEINNLKEQIKNLVNDGYSGDADPSHSGSVFWG